MEPDIAAELVQEIEQNENVEMGALVIDDVTTTASLLRKTLPHSFNKWVILAIKRNTSEIHYMLFRKIINVSQAKKYHISKKFLVTPWLKLKNNPEALAKSLALIFPYSH